MKMYQHAVLLSTVILCGGCPETQSDAPSGPVEVSAPGFSVTLPSSATTFDVGASIPGATFLATYEDSLGNIYIAYTTPADSVPMFSSDEVNPSARFDGFGITSTGDFIILVTGRGQTGDSTLAISQLADGQLVYVGTDFSNSLKNNVFGSIDLVDTDGRAIEQAFGEAPALVTPVVAGVVALNDGSEYVVSSSADTQQVSQWAAGDRIFAHDASDFGAATSVFLTKIGEWDSVLATPR